MITLIMNNQMKTKKINAINEESQIRINVSPAITITFDLKVPVYLSEQ